MADLSLNFIVVPTYSSQTIAVVDASTYPDSPPISAPTIEITIPGFGLVSLPFNPNEFNIFNAQGLGLTNPSEQVVYIPNSPLPDGIYTLTYSVTPAYQNYVTKTIMRVEQLQERFDEAFMKMDMMECDKAIKKQQREQLGTIYFFIQGAVAAANNCAVDEANKLYVQASKMLSNFINNGCNCSGTNYITNFY